MNLTNTFSSEELGPTWSATDTDIAFYDSRAGYGIEAVSAGGSNRRVLAASRLYPAWRRIP